MQDRKAWLMERRSYIGASDIGAIANISTYKTSLEVYLDKTSDMVNEKNSNPLLWGTMLEPVIADNYAHVTGYSIECEAAPLRHPDYPFIAANIDRWVNNKSHILECKTAHISKMREWGDNENSDNVPDTYLCQIAQQAFIGDFFTPSGHIPKVDIRVGFYEIEKRPLEDIDINALPNIVTEETYPKIIKYKTYTYERDKDLENKLLKIGINFWNNNVLKRIPPSCSTIDDCSLLYPVGYNNPITADIDIEAELQLLRSLKAEQASLTTKINSSVVKVKSFMQENDALLDSMGLVVATWKNTTRGNRMFSIKQQGEN